MMQYTNYHRILRISTLVCAVALVFESGLVDDSTIGLSQNTHRYVASVIGMSASVQPTELNELTASITQRQRELDAREAALKAREIQVNLSGGLGGTEKTTYVLSGILFILLVLILLNYVLDYIRLKEQGTLKPV
jgi:hypothetical protein